VAVPNGYREGTGNRVINRPEANKLVDAVEECCKDDQYQGMTMGIIVLQGEAQAYHIEEKLLQRIGAEEMENRRLICGNPYSFQGDERDITFLSMVAAPNERIGVMSKASDQRRFNVAASRAKDQTWLFYSSTINHLSEQCLRRRLLEYFLNPVSQISQALGENAEELRETAYKANRTIEKAPAPFDSWFEVDVALQIAGNGYRVVPQYEFADKRIDLVIQGEKSQLAVECDGDFWHGIDEYSADMERQRKLERCGWQFFRIRESRYYSDSEKALEPLWTLLDRMGIKSLFDSTEPEFEEDENGLDEDDDIKVESFISRAQEETKTETTEEVPSQQEKREESLGLDLPENIHQALRIKADVICKAIIQVLKQRPKFSSVREKIPTYILKLWSIRSRGKPREQFVKRVDEQIAIMARKGYVIVYKSKNIRVKLGWVEYPNQ
jgi:very-short-patch-repair endonuclease